MISIRNHVFLAPLQFLISMVINAQHVLKTQFGVSQFSIVRHVREDKSLWIMYASVQQTTIGMDLFVLNAYFLNSLTLELFNVNSALTKKYMTQIYVNALTALLQHRILMVYLAQLVVEIFTLTRKQELAKSVLSDNHTVKASKYVFAQIRIFGMKMLAFLAIFPNTLILIKNSVSLVLQIRSMIFLLKFVLPVHWTILFLMEKNVFLALRTTIMI